MVFKKLRIFVLWTKVASALEGFMMPKYLMQGHFTILFYWFGMNELFLKQVYLHDIIYWFGLNLF